MKSNGNGKWSVAFWLLTAFTMASFTWTTWCFFTNSGKIEKLTALANHTLTSIDKRLYRIELAHGIYETKQVSSMQE